MDGLVWLVSTLRQYLSILEDNGIVIDLNHHGQISADEEHAFTDFDIDANKHLTEVEGLNDSGEITDNFAISLKWLARTPWYELRVHAVASIPPTQGDVEDEEPDRESPYFIMFCLWKRSPHKIRKLQNLVASATIRERDWKLYEKDALKPTSILDPQEGLIIFKKWALLMTTRPT